MGEAPHTAGGALSKGKLKLADAGTGDVRKGKKFYSGDKTLNTGKLVLNMATSGSLTRNYTVPGEGYWRPYMIISTTKQDNKIVISAKLGLRDRDGTDYTLEGYNYVTTITVTI